MKNIHWYLIGIIYLGFFLWYTNLSGPLTKTEIEKYLSEINISADGLMSDIHAEADYRAHLIVELAKRAVAKSIAR